MILFGAGSSTPFDIPGMEGFTEQFIERNKDLSEFISNIRDAISRSEGIIGFPLSFDLETLLAVLTDLSSVTERKPISIPTASLLLKESLDIKAARGKYGTMASPALDRLREFIFNVCMQPIENGKKDGNFRNLDQFYGPLMTMLNKTGLENIQTATRNIYSTNWDLCFKTWVDYVNVPINDGVGTDRQNLPVFDVTQFDKDTSRMNYVALHGSLDLAEVSRPKGSGTYKDIQKISDPLGYFKGKPMNIKNIFMIYPLEAVGYEESVKSPYLDMLNHFKTGLRSESDVFIIGYSLRDPTIGSIFEEVIAERIRGGDLNLLSGQLDYRRDAVRTHRLKIIVINPNPEKLVENLRKQSRANLLQTFVPIRIRFPKITDADFHAKYVQALRQLLENLDAIGYMGPGVSSQIRDILNSRYGIKPAELGFPQH